MKFNEVATQYSEDKARSGVSNTLFISINKKNTEGKEGLSHFFLTVSK